MTRKAIDDAETETKSIFAEGSQLERQGKLDDAAVQRIEASLQEVHERLESKLADKLSRIAAKTTTQPKGVWTKVFGVILFLAMLGFICHLTLGRNFIFAYDRTYKAMLPALFVLALTPTTLLWFLLERRQHALSWRYPTWAVRWLVVFPFTVLLFSAAVVYSPYGWSALVTWIFGTQAQPRAAEIVSVGSLHASSRFCKQELELDINGTRSKICIEGWRADPSPSAGDSVHLQGRSTSLGVLVEAIMQ